MSGSVSERWRGRRSRRAAGLIGTRRGAILERLEVGLVDLGRLLVVDVRVEHHNRLDEKRCGLRFPAALLA